MNAAYRRVRTLRKSKKSCKRFAPVANLQTKFQTTSVTGAVFPHFGSHKSDILHGGAEAGENPIFRPLSKRNTGMAAMRQSCLWQTNENMTLFRLQPVCDLGPSSNSAWWYRRSVPCLHPLKLFRIRPLVSLVGAIEDLWENAHIDDNSL